MDRLLIVDPNELVFDFELRQRCSSFISLKNVMFTMPVAFRISASSAARKYAIKPAQGIIPPAGRVTIEIILNPQSSLPDQFPFPGDKFIVKSLVVPGGAQHSSVSNDWFESKKNFIYADSGLKAVFKGTAIVQALVARGSIEDVREVLELGVDLNRPSNGQEQSATHVAIASGRPEMVPLLVEFGADLELRDRSGKTPLHEAAASGQSLITELLLANGANADARTESVGWTPLHFAANSQHTDTVRVLLGKTDVNSTAGPDNRTALHLAAAGGGADCLKLLLEGGAAVNATTSTGLTALHIAASQADVASIRVLLDHCAMRNVRDVEGHIPFDAAVEAGAENEVVDVLKLGDDLRRAARRGDLKSVRICLKQGANVNGRDQNGWTALHCAAFKGHVDVVRLLVERNNAEVNCVDAEGYSPLLCAVEMGQCDVVRILMSRGADVNLKAGSSGVSAVQLGRFMGDDGVVSLLIEGGARNSLNNLPPNAAAGGKQIKAGSDAASTLKNKKGGVHERFGSRRQQSFEALAC